MRKDIWRSLNNVSVDRLAIILGVVTFAIQQLLHWQDGWLVGVITTSIWFVVWALFNTVRLRHAYDQDAPNDLWTLLFRSKIFPIGMGVIVLVVWATLWLLNRMDWLTKTVVFLPTILLLIAQSAAADKAVKAVKAGLTPNLEEVDPT